MLVFDALFDFSSLGSKTKGGGDVNIYMLLFWAMSCS